MHYFQGEEHLINSVKRLFEIVDDKYMATTVNPKQWIFRGHSDQKYELIPGVGRLWGKTGFETVDKIKFLEEQSLRYFRIQTYHEIREKNDFIILAVAQHHGMKTRLLDWTFSPLIALFFAVENQNDHNVNGNLYALNMDSDIVDVIKNEEKNPLDPKNIYNYLYVPFLSPRIKPNVAYFNCSRIRK